MLMRSKGLLANEPFCDIQFAYELLPSSSLQKASRTQNVSRFIMLLFTCHQVALKYIAIR